MQITLELGLISSCTTRGPHSCFGVRAWTFSPSLGDYPRLAHGKIDVRRHYLLFFGSQNIVMPWETFKTQLASFILEGAQSSQGYLPHGAVAFLKAMAGDNQLLRGTKLH